MLFECVAHLSWRCTAFLQPVPLHSELTLCCDVLQLSWDFLFFFFFFASRTRRHAALCRVCLKLSFVPRREQHNQGSVLFKDHNVGRSFSLGLRCFASAALAEVMRPPTFTPQPFSPHTWCDEETKDCHFARWLSLKRQRWTDEDISS